MRKTTLTPAEHYSKPRGITCTRQYSEVKPKVAFSKTKVPGVIENLHSYGYGYIVLTGLKTKDQLYQWKGDYDWTPHRPTYSCIGKQLYLAEDTVSGSDAMELITVQSSYKSFAIDPNSKAELAGLDLQIHHRIENIHDLETKITRNKLQLFNKELSKAKDKLIDQEEEIQLLRSRNKKLETKYHVYDKESGLAQAEEVGLCKIKALNQSEKESVRLQKCLEKKDAECLELNRIVNALSARIRSLESQREEYNKDNYSCDRKDLWYEYGETDESQEEIKGLLETIRLELNLKHEIQRELDKSLKKEALLQLSVFNLEDDNKKKESKMIEIARQRDEYLRAKIYMEAEMVNMCKTLQNKIQCLVTQLEQRNAEFEVLKEQVTTERTKITQMSLEIISLQDQVNDKNRQIEHFYGELEQSRDEKYDIQFPDAFKLERETETEFKKIISKQMSDIKCLQDEIARKDIEFSNFDEVKKQTKIFQQSINKLQEKVVTFRNTSEVLQSRNEEKENEVKRLNQQLNELSKLCNERETMNRSIDHQLKFAQTKLKKQELEISHEKELVNTNRKRLLDMSEERDRLSLKLKEKEIALQEVNERFKNNVQRKEEAEAKLNEIEHQHKMEIKRLQYKMEKKDIDKTRIDQLDAQDKHLQQFIKESNEREAELYEIKKALQNTMKEKDDIISTLTGKEAKLHKSNQILQKRNEQKQCKVNELKQQLNEMSRKTTQKEIEFGKKNRLLETQLKSEQVKLQQQELEISKGKELLTIKEKEMSKMSKENESLDRRKNEIEEKLQECIKLREEADLRLNEIADKLKNETYHFKKEIEKRDIQIAKNDELDKRSKREQQNIDELYAKESELRLIKLALESKNTEKNDKSNALKRQLDEMSVISNQKENQLQQTNHSLCTQLKATESNSFKLSKDIMSLKQEVKQKENKLQEYNVKYKEAEKIKQETERTLNKTINNQLCIIQQLQTEIEKRDVEMSNFDQDNKRNEHDLQQELIKLKERESALRKTSQDLQNRIDEKDNEIVKLKLQLENMSKELNQKENELQNNNLAIKRQLQTAEREMNQLRIEITNERELVSKHQKQEVEMGEEIKCLKQELIQLKENDSALQNTRQDFQNRIDEKDNEIVKLKLQLENMSKESYHKENELQINNLAIKRQLQTAERELKQLRIEITNERELVSTNQKQEVEMGEEIKCLKQELIQLKEKDSALQNTRQDFQNRIDEKDNEIVKLKLQLENMSKESYHKENELQNNNLAIKRQLQTAERELKQLRIEITNERELVSTNQKQEVEMGEEIKCLKQELIQLKEKDSALQNTRQDFQNRIDEKDNEIVKLKLQLENMSKESYHQENELRNNNLAIKRQLQTVERELKQLRIEITNERELVSKNQKQEVEMGEEIKCLKQKVKLTERQLEEMNDAMEQKHDAELKLDRTIAKQNSDNQRFIKEIERKNDELASLDEKIKHFKEIQKLYLASQEKESTLQKKLNELNAKNHENENRITDLTQRLLKTIEKSHQMESELNDKNISLHKKIRSLESDIETFKQEISNEKRVENSNQTKMSEMKARIDTLMNELKMKEDEQQKIKDNLNAIINSHKKKIQHLERNILQQEKKMRFVEVEKNNELKEIKNKNAENEKQLQQALSRLHEKESELDDTKSRLSRVMGDKLTDKNPNITDLSDKNRPTKIAEKCAELYDNEWTDAFDILGSRIKVEKTVIEVLLQILQDAMSFCMAMARCQIETIEREMNFADKDEMITISSEIQKMIKERRKASASVVAGNLKKIYMTQLKQSGDKLSNDALDVDEYTSECIEICWFMLIQDPPVVFCPLPTKGSPFDTNFYKPYTKSGSHVEFAVWPSLLLHDGGPILAKGVAQGYVRK